jgi:hypothetical protein
MIFYTDFWKNMIEILKQDAKLNDMINRNVFLLKILKNQNCFDPCLLNFFFINFYS